MATLMTSDVTNVVFFVTDDQIYTFVISMRGAGLTRMTSNKYFGRRLSVVKLKENFGFFVMDGCKIEKNFGFFVMYGLYDDVIKRGGARVHRYFAKKNIVLRKV